MLPPRFVGRELPAARGGESGSFVGGHVESSVLDRVWMVIVVDRGYQQQRQAFAAAEFVEARP